MAISDKITDLNNTKTAIKTSLTSKGLDLSTTPFSQYSEKIDTLKIAKGNAVRDDVLYGKTFSNNSEVNIIGSYTPSPFGGKGTEQEPYLIWSIDDFNNIPEKDEPNVYFKLMNDLNGGYDKITQIPVFDGIFDGNGHKIIQPYFADFPTDFISVFGSNYGTIKNLNIVGPDYTLAQVHGEGKDSLGFLCGINTQNGYIFNCSVNNPNFQTNSYTSITKLGLLCLINQGTIESCYCTGEFSHHPPETTSTTFWGQIAGLNEGTIKGCVCSQMSTDNFTGCKILPVGSGNAMIDGTLLSLINVDFNSSATQAISNLENYNNAKGYEFKPWKIYSGFFEYAPNDMSYAIIATEPEINHIDTISTAVG